MVNQFSPEVRNAMANQFEAVVGLSMLVRCYNAGSLPANTAAPATGTPIAEGVAPPDYLGAASGGQVSLLGTLTVTGLPAAGTTPGTAITYVRFFNNAGTVCHRQCTAGGQVTVPTSSATAANGVLLVFASGAGIQVGMQVSGTGIVPGTTVLAVAGGNVTISQASVAGVSSGASITFKADLAFDNASISTGQVATITSDSIAIGGA